MNIFHSFVSAIIRLFAFGQTPNQKFQRHWYNFRPFVKVSRNAGNALPEFNSEFVAQLAIADTYGGPQLVWLGDSNVDYANRRRVMEKFDKLAVNLGVGGSATEDWIAFLTGTAEGGAIVERLQRPGVMVVFNIGGNDILHRRNTKTRENLKKLRELAPNSVYVAVPPVFSSLVAANTEISEEVLIREIDEVNGWGAGLWKDGRFLDMHAALQDKVTGDFLVGTARDFIHYSERAFKDIIIPALNQMSKQFL